MDLTTKAEELSLFDGMIEKIAVYVLLMRNYYYYWWSYLYIN